MTHRVPFLVAELARTWTRSSFTCSLRLQRKSGPGLRKVALETIGAAADNHAANVLPLIREIRKAGATTLREIADALNARGVQTARGGHWYAMTVSNMLAHA
jgi:hypothetical protein